jgi:hypothetical protein
MVAIQVPNLGPGTFTADVVDNNGDPNTVLEAAQDFRIVCSWRISQAAANTLGGQFELAAYVESIGPGPEQQVGRTVTVPVTGNRSYGPFDIVVPGGTLPNNVGPGQSGAYKLVTLLTHRNFGRVSDVAALVEERVLRIS